MEVLIFGKPECPQCVTTKNKLMHFIQKWGLAERVKVNFHDMTTPEGMAEGAFNDVSDIPTTIIRRGEQAVARWEGVVPTTKELRQYVQEQVDAS